MLYATDLRLVVGDHRFITILIVSTIVYPFNYRYSTLGTQRSVMMMATKSVPADWSALPSDLPVPVDDGEADHLRASAVSRVELPTSVLLRATGTLPGIGQGDGEAVVNLRALSFDGPVLVFVYPRTGQPGVANPPGWDAIPGARGCTPVSRPLISFFLSSMNAHDDRSFVLSGTRLARCKRHGQAGYASLR